MAGGERVHLERILVVKLADIGDLLTATPALRALRETFERTHIAALVTPAAKEVLAGSSLVDDLLVFDKHRYDALSESARFTSIAAAMALLLSLRKKRYDCIVVLHHLVTRWGMVKYAALALTSGARYRVGLDNGRGWFLTHRIVDRGFGFRHEVEYALAVVGAIGASVQQPKMEIEFSMQDRAMAERLLVGVNSRPLIAIHPGSGTYSLLRRWPAGCFARVADRLASAGASILLVGGRAEIDLCREVAAAMRTQPRIVAGETSVKELAALLAQCDLFIGNDSGVMHIAAAVGSKIVAIFGPSNHRAWAPWTASGPLGETVSEHGVIVRAAMPCSPCLYGRDWERKLGNPSSCPRRRECLLRVTPEMVLDAAQSVLEGEWRAARRAKVEQGG